jgi:hypothetical protein
MDEPVAMSDHENDFLETPVQEVVFMPVDHENEVTLDDYLDTLRHIQEAAD